MVQWYRDLEIESDADELGIAEAVAGDSGDPATTYVELAKISEPLLQLLEELPTDSKCEALSRLLDSVGTVTSPEFRVCVFTRFVDTATYLESALRDRCPHVKLLTGGHSLAEREQGIADFAQSGGILIVTEAIRLPMPEVVTVVFYDIPLNPAVFEARKGQFVRVGRRGPLQIVAFADESNVLAIERLQRKIVEVKAALGESEIEDALFSIGSAG